MLVGASVPVTRWTRGSTTLPACRRCRASRSPEYSSEEEEEVEEVVDDDEEDEDEVDEVVVGVPCCLSRGDAERGGDSGSAEDALDGGARLMALEADAGAELPLYGGFLTPPAPPSFPGGVRTESGMETCNEPPWGEGKFSCVPRAVAGLVMLYGDSFLEISRLGGKFQMLLSLSKLIGSAISVLIFRTEEGVPPWLFGEPAEARRWEEGGDGLTSGAVSPIVTGLGDVEDKRSLRHRDPSHFCTFLLFRFFRSFPPASTLSQSCMTWSSS